ncbi:lysozyme [Methylopila musalis]|uniref:Lysozyme n=1 Tax=Methylopila musalis TaxID=1134781 RepID=A0ABW3Z3J3_9HYPH
MASPMTAIGLAALKSREGVRLTAYKDSVGVWTIGYGSTKGVKQGDKITQARADELLMEDLAAHDITAFVTVPLADHEADALRSIAFNIGLAGAKGSTFIKRLNTGESRQSVAEAIMMWKKPAEIISRREAERDQFLTPYTKALPKARSNDAKPVTAPAEPAAPEPDDILAGAEPEVGEDDDPAARLAELDAAIARLRAALVDVLVAREALS